MEAKEFKEKFKVGDLIRSVRWHKNGFVKIEFIGERRFFVINHQGVKAAWDFDEQDWQHYQEPVKKDLEGVRSWVLVSKYFDGVRVDVLYGDENYVKYLKTIHIDSQEIITIDEAIERGLKL